MAALMLAPAEAWAQDQPPAAVQSAPGAGHGTLSATVHVSLTIVAGAQVGLTLSQRSGAALSLQDLRGLPMDDTGMEFTIRDSRGERRFVEPRSLSLALGEVQRSGERNVEVTLIF